MSTLSEKNIRDKLYNFDYHYQNDNWNSFKKKLPKNKARNFIKYVVYTVATFVIISGGYILIDNQHYNSDKKLKSIIMSFNYPDFNRRVNFADVRIDNNSVVAVSDKKGNSDLIANIDSVNKSETIAVDKQDTTLYLRNHKKPFKPEIGVDVIDFCSYKLCFYVENFEDYSSIKWSFGDGNFSNEIKPCHVFDKAGKYNISLTINTSDSLIFVNKEINIHETPTADFSYTNNENVFNFKNLSKNADTFYWDFNIPGINTSVSDPVIKYDCAGKYNVALIAKDLHNCYDTIIKQIIVPEINTFFMPNAFSPNGDGVCDLVGPEGLGIENSKFEFQIFNGYGELVFKTNDFNEKWNGKIMNTGDNCPSGYYIWNVQITNSENKTIKRKGILRLLK